MFLQSIIRCDLLKKIAGILIAAVLILTFFCRLIGTGTRRAIEALSEESRKSFHKTVILDAGHGGEDGGAVGVDGSLEKDINLAIANAASAFLTLFGIAHISVRTTDKSVCDEGLKTVRERKRSDILNRDALVRSTENSLLVSIHQNHYSDARYSGAQMFYSSNNPSSAILAEQLRQSIIQGLQPDNARENKASGANIYLLYHAEAPAVLVECGFISNRNEVKKLNDPVYDAQMAFYISKGILNYLNLSEETC